MHEDMPKSIIIPVLVTTTNLSPDNIHTVLPPVLDCAMHVALAVFAG